MDPNDDMWYVMNCINQFIAFFDAHDGTRRVEEFIRRINERDLFTEEDCGVAYINTQINELVEYLDAHDGEENAEDIIRRINNRDFYTEKELNDALNDIDSNKSLDESDDEFGDCSLPF